MVPREDVGVHQERRPELPALISSVPGVTRSATPDPPAAPLIDRVPPAALAAPAVQPVDRVLSAAPVPPAQVVPPVLPAVSATPADAAPSAVLHLWDGRSLDLTGTALMGRNPTPRDAEPAPTHRLTIDDPTRSVSKTHLVVGVDARGVWLRDRGSTNGTVVQSEGSRVQCAPHVEVRVPPGARVAFGRYWFTVG